MCRWVRVIFVAETVSPEPGVKDQQIMIPLSILDGVPRAGLVQRVVKLPAMKSFLWDGGGQWGRVGARRAAFITALLVVQG